MKKIISVLLGVLLLAGCSKEEIAPGTPECVIAKINTIKEGPVWNPPAKVYSFRYEGETVYFFPSRCCDFTSELFDKDCNLICAPDGGITGEGDGQCPEFFNERTNGKLIWEDERN